jgi:hypothetical protein
LANFISDTLERSERLGGSIFASLFKLLTVELAFMGKLGLVALGEGGTLTSDVGGKNADITVQRPKVRVAQGISGLIGHAKCENHLADITFMNKCLQLRAVTELQGQNKYIRARGHYIYMYNGTHNDVGLAVKECTLVLDVWVMGGANILLQSKEQSFLRTSETSTSGHNRIIESIKQSKTGVLDTEEVRQRNSGFILYHGT